MKSSAAWKVAQCGKCDPDFTLLDRGYSGARKSRAVVAVFPLFAARMQLREFSMPSLFRFLTLIGVLGGIAYGAMFLLATWFDPKPREITVTIPADRFAKQP
jgi:hypothetical protein